MTIGTVSLYAQTFLDILIPYRMQFRTYFKITLQPEYDETIELLLLNLSKTDTCPLVNDEHPIVSRSDSVCFRSDAADWNAMKKKEKL